MPDTRTGQTSWALGEIGLAGRNALVLGHQRRALAGDEALDRGALRLEPEAALPLLGGRDPELPDRQPLFLPSHQAAGSAAMR